MRSMHSRERTLLAGLAGGILGIALTGAGFWLAGRERAPNDLPRLAPSYHAGGKKLRGMKVPQGYQPSPLPAGT